KVKAPTLFFEKTGWREVAVSSPAVQARAPGESHTPRAAAWIGENSRLWIALSVLALSWLCAVLTEHIRRPWVNLVDFNGAVWSQAAHNILRAGLVRTEGASTGFYFGPLPIPPAGYYLHHPPLLHLALTWMFAIFGEHEWVARLLPIACSLASGVLLWLLVRSCAGTRAAAFSLAVFACLPMELRYGSMVNFEPVVLTFVLAALCCLRQWHVTGRAQWKALAAACMMTGLWVDWAMYIFALILCIYWFARPRLKMRGMAWLLTAFMLVSGALFLLRIEMLRPDALQSLSDAFFRRIGSKPESHIHFTELQWVEKIAHILFIHFLATGWALAFAGGAIIRRRKSAGDADLAWLGWACAAMGAMDFVFLCVFQDESYIHQYIGYYLVAPVAALGGVALDEMVAWLQARIARRSPWGFAGACIPCLALIIFCGWTGIEQRNALSAQFLVLDYTTPEPPDLIPELGETIRENFPPGTNILCNFQPDYGPQLEYYAQRNLLNNVCEYRFWRQFLGNPKLQNPGGVIWMNTQGAGEIVANLPPGDRRFVRVGNFSFCIWKPAANPSASVKPPKVGRS
ncbi:MAG TPA: glycosyltransferase family 39 protein, partial [Chthoniobacteraceae bacterium]|nr:glycosyltransferase family 39 protein [Chthoniobacteraceae bacterium]